jgi:hypothetical protein
MGSKNLDHGTKFGKKPLRHLRLLEEPDGEYLDGNFAPEVIGCTVYDAHATGPELGGDLVLANVLR